MIVKFTVAHLGGDTTTNSTLSAHTHRQAKAGLYGMESMKEVPENIFQSEVIGLKNLSMSFYQKILS